MAVCAAPPVDCTLAGRARRCLDRNQFEHDEIIAADIANDNAGSCRRVLALPATMLPARRASIAESFSRQSRQPGTACGANANAWRDLTWGVRAPPESSASATIAKIASQQVIATHQA
jgi:hypothetical protein